jgi:DNA polymerase-3 subunit delta'
LASLVTKITPVRGTSRNAGIAGGSAAAGPWSGVTGVRGDDIGGMIYDPGVPRLSDIRGQDRAIARLRAALGAGRVHHAYLFTGPPGAGKHATALALASALNCLQAPGEGCDECDACSRIAEGIHPDVVTLEREGAAQIVPIESIRQNVIARIGLPPHEARVRVFVITEASTIALQPAAANALLKTLEEPPARTMFVLATVAPDQLLPTIRSRCQRVSFAGGVPGGEGDKLDALARELAEFTGDGRLTGAGLDKIVVTAQRLAGEEKGATAVLLDRAARRMHDAARAAVDAGAAGSARVLGARARICLEAHTAVTIHNAHPQLALEGVLGKLWSLRP